MPDDAQSQTPFEPVMPTGAYDDWGRLVLSWATGEAAPPGEPFSDNTVTRFVLPASKQLGTPGAGVMFPDSVQEVIFVRDTSTRRYVRLPDPVMAKAAQEDIKQGADYELPEFYSDAPLNCQMPTKTAEKLLLQLERIGDYSIGSCM